MHAVTLPNMPEKRAQDFMSDDEVPLYARVIYAPLESKGDRRSIEVQAFQVDADGRLVAMFTGAPSRTQGTVCTISTTGIGDTHTVHPGFVRRMVDARPEALPDGVVAVEKLPEKATKGQQFYKEPYIYEYCDGMLLDCMSGKAEELFKLIRQSDSISDLVL